MSNHVMFVVGNTHRNVREANAKLDHSRTYRKTHDWTLYVDVISGDKDIIDHVTFDMQHSSFRPQVFTHRSPTRITDSNGRTRWRFATRQQTYGVIPCQITLKGCGGSDLTLNYRVRSSNHEEVQSRRFVESRPQKALGPVPIPNVSFGVELELTSSRTQTPDQVAQSLTQQSGHDVAIMTEEYGLASRTYDTWKLMRDSSIECHITRPDCNAFELVSPILSGMHGLSECNALVMALGRVPSLKVNKSMGFHVHVSVQNVGLKKLIKICQQFIKYEEAMDAFMPPSRCNNTFCKSNKAAVPGATNKLKHEALARCRSLEELCDKMNPSPGERYYKLNLQNIKTGRQPTIEFRQHSATVSTEKILSWIRFCVLLVSNSARVKAPTPLKASRTQGEQVDMLFDYVIKDRYLARFYKDRRKQLRLEMRDGDQDYCCDGCSHGGGCSAVRTVRTGVVRTTHRYKTG